MKNTYDDIDKLLKDMRSDIEDTLSKEVFEEVRDIEMEHVYRDVLSTYSPKIYDRRGTSGIDDPRNVIGYVKDMSLEVDNVTPFNDGYGTYNRGNGLADLINEGDGGASHLYYDFTGNFIQPRPFLDNTQEEIDKTDRVDRTLEKGLKRRGHDIS